jgi:hypothetical protein
MKGRKQLKAGVSALFLCKKTNEVANTNQFVFQMCTGAYLESACLFRVFKRLAKRRYFFPKLRYFGS